MIIGLTGKAGSGKGVSSEILTRFATTDGRAVMVLPLAKPIKDFARQLGWNGEKDAKGRRLLQLLGVEIGRECFHDNFWIDRWQAAVDEFLEKNGRNAVVICDDVRFENEAKHVRSKAGVVVHILGRGGLAGVAATHASERGIPDHLVDETVDNSGTMEDLERRLRFVYEKVVNR
jgi:hypothetical protein